MTQMVWHPKGAKFKTEFPHNWAEDGTSGPEYSNSRNLQWAHGKAGEDRVHVVLSEEQGWLFVGIYDGFSGPDAPNFLMSNLYKAIDKELEGMLWAYEDKPQNTMLTSGPIESDTIEASSAIVTEGYVVSHKADDELEKDHSDLSLCGDFNQKQCDEGVVPIGENEDESGSKLSIDMTLRNESIEADELVVDKNGVHTVSEISEDHGVNMKADAAGQVDTPVKEALNTEATNSAKQSTKSKRLYQLLQMELVKDKQRMGEDLHYREAQLALCSASIKGESTHHTDRADSLRESERVSVVDSKDSKHRNTASFSFVGHRQTLARSLIGSKLRKMYRKQKSLQKKLFPWSYDWHREQHQVNVQMCNPSVIIRRCESGPVDHDAVLRSMAKALATTEQAYMEMVERSLDRNPELALMGSCVLVMLMKDLDAYVMNLSDSRVVLAQDKLNDCNIGENHAKDDARIQNRSTESLVHVELDRISEESPMHNPNHQACSINKNKEISLCRLKMKAVQRSIDDSTNIEEP